VNAETFTQFGFAGLLILVYFLLQRDRDKRAAALDQQKLTIEEKKAEAMTAGFTSLARKIDDHHTSDLEAHSEMTAGLGEIKGQLNEARWYREEITNPGATPPRGVRTPRRGTHHDEEDVMLHGSLSYAAYEVDTEVAEVEEIARPPIATPRTVTDGALTMQVYTMGKWHRRTPDLSPHRVRRSRSTVSATPSVARSSPAISAGDRPRRVLHRLRADARSHQQPEGLRTMSIVSNLIPFATDHWDDISAAALLIGGWLWHKARGDKTKTAREILEDVVRQVLYSDGVDLDNVKSRAESKIREALAKRNVTGKLAEALVHEFVEYAAAELAERFALFQKNLDALATNAAKAAAVPDAASFK
jgi:hypothetical protein